MKAELIQYVGSDIITVNAARVSFDKESDWLDLGGREGTSGHSLSMKDIKLINYLAEHNHFTPFTHSTITMRETVPIFVARQRFKHVVGFTYNETSRRYVDDAPEFYEPSVWRGRPTGSAKQGSSDEVVDILTWPLQVPNSEWPNPSWTEYPIDYEGFLYIAESFYNHLIERGVAPEQARMVLPQSMYTSYYCTGSLAAWARAYKLRSDPHAQKEIQDLATQWNDIIAGVPEMKYSWNALTS